MSENLAEIYEVFSTDPIKDGFLVFKAVLKPQKITTYASIA